MKDYKSIHRSIEGLDYRLEFREGVWLKCLKLMTSLPFGATSEEAASLDRVAELQEAVRAFVSANAGLVDVVEIRSTDEDRLHRYQWPM